MPPVISLGNLLLEPDQYRVWIGQRVANLTFTEFRLLALLANSPEQVFAHAELMRVLQPQSDTSRGLAMHIYQLRKKLAGSAPYTVATIRKRGYALVQGRRSGRAGVGEPRKESHAHE